MKSQAETNAKYDKFSINSSKQNTQKQKVNFRQQNRQGKITAILQQQRLLHAENIEDLRAELKQGEACLVCGSTEHPYWI